jgi:hypothetical protein
MYLAPSANLMGLLFLPRPRKQFGRTEALVPNPVLRLGRQQQWRWRWQRGGQQQWVADFDRGSISYVPILFVLQGLFKKEIKATVIPAVLP